MRKSTLILLVVVVALGALIFFWERKQPSTDERAESDRQFVDFKSDAVSEITRTGFQPVTLKKGKDSRWSMAGPVEDVADGSAVQGFLDRIRMARIERKVDRGVSCQDPGARLPQGRMDLHDRRGPREDRTGRQSGP